ncbi:phenylalanine--tRNA ligase beta subunit-related protein [Streptomyces sp. NPDC048636]|uniref:B3/B4 domain-containing protein n=1 Tax=Streptomyces sp. NPDC048636 TaxID=3155762 RepID=UPI003414AA30
MRLLYSSAVRAEHPELVSGALHVTGITTDVPADALASAVARHTAVAERRLGDGTEGEFPEIQAWRRAFTRMGVKPTQYRNAAEALLRRYRKDTSLPSVHPLVELCNAISVAYAIPVGVFDLACVTGPLEVRHAVGDEVFLSFSGKAEHPDPGEVIFADAAGRAHARRWTHRQSGHSVVRDTTASALIVSEGMHATAPGDVGKLIATVAAELTELWQLPPSAVTLTPACGPIDLPGWSPSTERTTSGTG